LSHLGDLLIFFWGPAFPYPWSGKISFPGAPHKKNYWGLGLFVGKWKATTDWGLAKRFVSKFGG